MNQGNPDVSRKKANRLGRLAVLEKELKLFRFSGGLFLFFLQFQILLVRIAFLAGFAVFMRGHTALVCAFLALGCGFFAAGFVFSLVGAHGGPRQKGDRASDDAQNFDKFHFSFRNGCYNDRTVAIPVEQRLPRRPPDWMRFRALSIWRQTCLSGIEFYPRRGLIEVNPG
jgi:hypothetical protein